MQLHSNSGDQATSQPSQSNASNSAHPLRRKCQRIADAVLSAAVYNLVVQKMNDTKKMRHLIPISPSLDEVKDTKYKKEKKRISDRRGMNRDLSLSLTGRLACSLRGSDDHEVIGTRVCVGAQGLGGGRQAASQVTVGITVHLFSRTESLSHIRRRITAWFVG